MLLPALPVEMGRDAAVPLAFGGEAFALVPKGGAAPEYRLELPARLPAPIAAGERVGTLHVSQGGREVAEVPVLAAQDAPRIGFAGVLEKLAYTNFAEKAGVVELEAIRRALRALVPLVPADAFRFRADPFKAL